MRFFSSLLIIIALLCAHHGLASEDVQNAPLEPLAFSRLPAFADPELSYSGKFLAFTQNLIEPEPLTLLTVANLSDGKSQMVLTSDNKKVKLNWYEWANDEVLLISAAYEDNVKGTRFYQTRLFSIDLSEEDPQLKQLVKPRRDAGVQVFGTYTSQYQDRVLDFMPEDPEHVIIAVDLDVPHMPSVYKLNVRTGRTSRIEKGKLSIRRWVLDRQHNLRIGISYNYNTGESRIYHRKTNDDDFEKLIEYQTYEQPSMQILGFDADPNIMYYKAYQDDKLSLFSMDLTTKESTLLLRHDDYDVSGGLIYSRKLKDVIGVYDAHSPNGRYYFDDYLMPFHDALNKIFPTSFNRILSFNKDESVYVLHTQADNLPDDFFIGNRNENTLDFLFSAYPEMEGTKLSHHKIVKYKARDGLEIEGYLTLPLTGEAPYPTVILPHGGPNARDYSGFNTWVAFMSNQGYAVFRPNFRGSKGYGYEFAKAQMRAWGLEMQDDITDATNWLVEEGIANAEKLCIVGGSYGGYAAAMATVKTPDLFKCAVAFAGVFDLKLLAKQQGWFLGGDLQSDKQFGDDADDLEARSPLYGVSKIKTPLLIMHGTEDVSVNIKQSREFVDALQDKNKAVKYIEFEYGDHYLSMQENRHQFFSELQQFLAAHLQ
uniref:alpha/beta hydrolase family protein n=1 Tax=Ningiella ruwaisensis TaxID=2364274 RepID=UPI00109F4997|nr:S9 family peptidase [Ningiella ruwaisensis]